MASGSLNLNFLFSKILGNALIPGIALMFRKCNYFRKCLILGNVLNLGNTVFFTELEGTGDGAGKDQVLTCRILAHFQIHFCRKPSPTIPISSMSWPGSWTQNTSTVPFRPGVTLRTYWAYHLKCTSTVGCIHSIAPRKTCLYFFLQHGQM